MQRLSHQGAFIKAGRNRRIDWGAGVSEAVGVSVGPAVTVGVGTSGVPSVSDANENPIFACADVVSSPRNRKLGMPYGHGVGAFGMEQKLL